MARSRTSRAAGRRAGEHGCGRAARNSRIGILALGALIGAMPAATMAAGPNPRPTLRAGAPSSPLANAPPTATSRLALLAAPAAAVVTLKVTTALDVVDPGDGKLSLREAVALANVAGATIQFAPAIEGHTIILTGGQLMVSHDVTIDGDRADGGIRVTIDAGHHSRVLAIAGSDTHARLDDLVLTRGSSGGADGGAILLGAGASLLLTDSAVTHNDTNDPTGFGGGGGGIYAGAASSLVIERTSISNNCTGECFSYGGGGGGIAAVDANVVISDSDIGFNNSSGGAGISVNGGTISIDRSQITDNTLSPRHTYGGGLHISYGAATISNSTISGNGSAGFFGGGIFSRSSTVDIVNCTIVNNYRGGLYSFDGTINIADSTFTGNSYFGVKQSGQLTIDNSIVSGNFYNDGSSLIAQDIFGITKSNGHNVFGSTAAGSVPGDRQNIAPGTIFATIDPTTGGGKLRPDGTVALRNNVANPAVSAGDPLAASTFDQRGFVRPRPAGSLPDLGAVEVDQPLSTAATANNDVRSGTNAANNLAGVAGNDYLKGLGGNDNLDGGPGGDLLDGGPGNDKLTGGTGLDLVAYPGAAAVVVDLSGTADTARRGGEKDTLIGIEGALGSSGADTFKGDALNNEFQGKAGKDTMTGGGGRDTWDLNDVADSPAGATRDVVTDFAPGQDIIDLAGVDADSTVPGNQSFRWVAKAVLTGAAQLGYFTTGGNTIVRASTDADAAPELEIQLTGVKVLTQGDFRP